MCDVDHLCVDYNIMEKPSYKLVGAPCGHHGQYTFYKAIKLSGLLERIVAIGEFFFVKIWQDSELISIGELQLLWTDRVSDQTLVSLRLYFLPENTPDGRGLHGEHEVLAINDKVVLKAEDLLSWLCVGGEWRWGLRAVWRGDCAPPADPRLSAALHHTKMDFSDIDKEKSAITIDEDSPGVVVFSYPRYCRYRALVARLEGIQADWLRDSLVAALGGYAAPTKNTRILYCKDTFEYPELEGHEFVCNHLSPKLKGRPRGRRRRAARSRDRSPDRSPDSRSSDSDGRHTPDTKTHRRLSLRNGPPEKEEGREKIEQSAEDEAFMKQLREFYREKSDTLKIAHTLKHMSLRLIYCSVISRGGYEVVCRDKLWRHLYADLGSRVRRLYERCLLPFENYERRLTKKLYSKGINGRVDDKIDTIEVADSPLREINVKTELPDKRLRTPSPDKDKLILDNETGEIMKDEMNITSKPAEQLNREFLESLAEPKDEEKPLKISVKSVEKLIEPSLKGDVQAFNDNRGIAGKDHFKDNILDEKDIKRNDGGFFNEVAHKLNLGNSDSRLLGELVHGSVPLAELAELWDRRQHLQHPPPLARGPLAELGALGDKHNGHLQKNRPAGRSSLRAVRVKPARPHNHTAHTPPTSTPHVRTDSASSSPPAPLTNFGIHHPPPPNNHSDDEIVEVPYKPKSPEIIDLDEYPESPQSVKKKKLDILKERGLEVTAVPPGSAWPHPIANPIAPLINPSPMMLSSAVQHQIMTQAQIYQMYNIIPPNYPNGIQAPKVIQASSAFGTAGPEKTVYGNPKDPFMPPPHVLQGTPIKPQRNIQTPPSTPQDILDLTCRSESPPSQKPAVEIVRIPPAPSPSPSKTPNSAQNLTKNYTLLDGKAVVGSNLEITLVNPKSQTPPTPPKRLPQKRSSNGKFAAKTPTPPKDYKYPPPSPSGVKKAPIVVPNYQIRDDVSPTSSTGSKDSQTSHSNLMNVFKGQTMPNLTPFMDPLYMNSFYSSLGQMDQRQLAMYRDFMATQFRGYSGLLNIGTPTTKN